MPSPDPTKNGCPNRDRDGDTFENERQVPRRGRDVQRRRRRRRLPGRGRQAARHDRRQARRSPRVATPIKLTARRRSPDVDAASMTTLRALAVELDKHDNWTLAIGARPAAGNATKLSSMRSRARFALVRVLGSLAKRDGIAETVGWDAVKAKPQAETGIAFLVLVTPPTPPTPTRPPRRPRNRLRRRPLRRPRRRPLRRRCLPDGGAPARRAEAGRRRAQAGRRRAQAMNRGQRRSRSPAQRRARRWRARSRVQAAAPAAAAGIVGVGHERADEPQPHVGTDYATRLINSPHDPEERMRGIQRAASIGSAESIALLVDPHRAQAGDQGGRARAPRGRARPRALRRSGTRAHRASPRRHRRQPGPREPTPPTPRRRRLSLEDGDPVARAELARAIAAIALARSGGDRALEMLYGAARGTGSGRDAAMLALTLHPPRDPGFFGTTGATLARSHRAPPRTARRSARARRPARGGAVERRQRAQRGARFARGARRRSRGSRSRGPPSPRATRGFAPRPGRFSCSWRRTERFKATSALISDEATTAIGMRLAERVHSAEITKLVAARAHDPCRPRAPPRGDPRARPVRRLRTPRRRSSAPPLLADRELAYHAILSLARSPAPNAGALIGGLLPSALASLAVRAYVVRALVRGERLDRGRQRSLKALARSATPAERALGVFARVALGEPRARAPSSATKTPACAAPRPWRPWRSPSDGRRTGAPREDSRRSATRSRARSSRSASSGGDPDGTVTTSALIDRAESGGGDAALAALALARRADDAPARKVSQLLGLEGRAPPRPRGERARGRESPRRDGSTRGPRTRTKPTSRYGAPSIAALAARDATTPRPRRASRRSRLAAELDPDAAVRQAARRALAGADAPFGRRQSSGGRLAPDHPRRRAGAGRRPSPARSSARTASRSRSSFDDEGYVLVPGLPPGDARLVLAPRLPRTRLRRRERDHDRAEGRPVVRGRHQAPLRDRPDARAGRPAPRGVAPTLRGRRAPLACLARRSSTAPRSASRSSSASTATASRSTTALRNARRLRLRRSLIQSAWRGGFGSRLFRSSAVHGVRRGDAHGRRDADPLPAVLAPPALLGLESPSRRSAS